MVNNYDATGRTGRLMIYRTVLTIIFSLGLFTLSTNFLLSLPQHQPIAQSSSSPPDQSITSPNTNQAMSLGAAKEQYLTVWNQTEFHIPFSTYVDPGFETAYGVYEEHSNIFAPGETMVLYLEPVAFGHQQMLDENGDTTYLMNFSADIIIADANGNEVATIQDLPIGSIMSQNQNTELHMTVTLTQDQPFPVGDYIITYIVHDQVSGESFQIEKTITIADDGDNAAATTSTV
jgi:hypothetical protein